MADNMVVLFLSIFLSFSSIYLLSLSLSLSLAFPAGIYNVMWLCKLMVSSFFARCIMRLLGVPLCVTNVFEDIHLEGKQWLTSKRTYWTAFKHVTNIHAYTNGLYIYIFVYYYISVSTLKIAEGLPRVFNHSCCYTFIRLSIVKCILPIRAVHTYVSFVYVIQWAYK